MSRLLAVLGCLCAVAALAHSAAVPTQDTIVVAKSDDTAVTPTPSVEDVTTEEPSPPIKLTEMDVVSDVSLRYAHTTVVAKVRNPAKKAQEANFRVLLPETAFISGFIMTLDGKSYKAYVKEKEEAKQIYQNAVNQGIGAAHISAKARDSNHFTVSVNVEASSNAIFNLTYEELLVRRNGVYNHAINLHPGALVPKLTVTVNIKETEKLVELRVPEIRTGNEIDASVDDPQNPKATIVKTHDDREATITFTPDLQEQERLIQIYTQKAKDSAAAASASTHYWSYSQPAEEVVTEGVLGQFVVQYDVARPKDGEILVNDGYFVHFFAPTELPALNKVVVFVLDTSGSMMDRKIIQLREAMQTILSELNEGDYFSIVEFASTVTVHDLKEADGEPPKTHSYSYFDFHDKKATLVPPSKATKENISKAKLIVSWLQANGGTNIGKALDVAVELINKGVDWVPSPADIADGSVTTAATTPAATTQAATTEAAKAEVAKTEEPKNLEPIIIFLTDGDPTVGETDPKRIITRVQETNSGPKKATIFSLAFGEDADRKFLRKLSLRNGGFMRHIYEAADAALQLRDFYRQISSPLLADLKFTYPAAQVRADSLTKNSFRTYYAGSELVVAGQVLDDVAELRPTVGAFCGVGDGYGRKRYEIVPTVPIEKKKKGYLPLERLWSYLTIKQLLDERDAAEGSESDDKENSPEKKALALALKYEFVTPLTSLVVVKPNATNAVNAESVDKAAGPGGFASGIPLSVSLAGRPMASHAYQPLSGGGAYGPPGAPPAYYPAAFGGGGGAGFASPDSISSVNRFEAEEVEDYDIPQEGTARMYFRSGSSTAGQFQIGQSQMESYPSSSSVLLSRSDDVYDYGSVSAARRRPTLYTFKRRRPAYIPKITKRVLGRRKNSTHPVSLGSAGSAPGYTPLFDRAAISYSPRIRPPSGYAFAAGQVLPMSYPISNSGGSVSFVGSAGSAAGYSPSFNRADFSYSAPIRPPSGYAFAAGQVIPMSYPMSKWNSGGSVSFDSFILSTPASRPTYLPETIVTSTSRPTLAELHLDGFTWIESLLDASAENILLQTNDTSAVVLKLSKDSVAPKEASDAECASAVEGGAGVCVYLSRCDAAKTITVDVFKTTYCTVSGGYAGVCCPQKKVDLTH